MKLFDPTRRRHLAALLLAGMFFVPSFAWGLNTVVSGFKAVQSGNLIIDAHSVCKNVCSSGQTYFVPTKTASEWTAFRNNKPGDVNVVDCSTPTCTYTGEFLFTSEESNTTACADACNMVGSCSSCSSSGGSCCSRIVTNPSTCHVYYATCSCSGGANACTGGINGACGGAHGNDYLSASAVNSAGLCSSGVASPSSVSGGGPWTWDCNGSGGGSSLTCSAGLTPTINGACGPGDGGSYAGASVPSGDLCSTGTYGGSNSNGSTESWTCVGSGGGTTDSCSASINVAGPINGICNNSIQNGCSAGTANDGAYADTGTQWRWRCDGQNGGSNSGMCSKNIPVAGSCGGANGNNYSTASAVNSAGLCSTGTASPSSVSGSGPWSWNCDGIDGGSGASCSATVTVNGTCGAANGQFYSPPAQPAAGDLCATGTVDSYQSTSEGWSWWCLGSTPAGSSYCEAVSVSGGPGGPGGPLD